MYIVLCVECGAVILGTENEVVAHYACIIHDIKNHDSTCESDVYKDLSLEMVENIIAKGAKWKKHKLFIVK
jgi:hypothetical protein